MSRQITLDEDPVSYGGWALLKDLAKFLKPYWLKFTLASIARLAGDLAWLYPAYALSFTVTFLSQYSSGDSLSPLWRIFYFWILVSVIRYWSQFFSKFYGFQVAEKVSLDAQLKTIRHLFLLDIAWHEKENSGNKLKRILKGGEGFNRILRMWIINVVEISVNFIGMTFIIYQFNKLIALLVGIFLVIYFTISFFLTRWAAEAEYYVNAKEEDVHGLSFEAINNIRSVKVMSMIGSLTTSIRKEIDLLFHKIKKRIKRFQTRSLVLELLSQTFRLGVLFYIAIGIAHGQFAIGLLVLFYGYFNYLWQSVAELSDISQDYVVSRYGIARMVKILQTPVVIDNEQEKNAFPKNWQKISVLNLSFGYENQKILKNISFDIHRGEKIGIVGLSGAGKSTLFKLLLKEYEAYQGQILIDQVPLKTIGKKDYFKNVAVVLQETEVFNFSLKDNITISNPDQEKNDFLLRKALDIAHVTDFANQLPQNLQTYIGEKGVKLSGGERQRVGLARAIFKSPEILLLDEATSHLDLESEKKIQDSLHKFFENVTAIVIAHRLTTIRAMDKILVLENGKIVEAGNFNKLLKIQGRFSELWKKQKL